MRNNLVEILLILGTSKPDGDKIIQKAVLEISKFFYIKKQSEILKTRSYEVDYTDYFYNQAIIVESNINIHSIFKKIQKIEKSFGQKRKNQLWGDRIIDIDIIFVGNLLYYDSKLNIPHESIYFRDYVKDLMDKIGWKNEKFW